ncbi:hypothetical protein ACFVMC_31475 [Nocardia sp. NPDC127579]|uniref:hypothetical protein n=1 Tax=Nocardia sp. NPDC127579 TaxID=3345402 RepID=UPI00363A1C77
MSNSMPIRVGNIYADEALGRACPAHEVHEPIAVAQSVRDAYESLDLDLAAAVNVALADRYDTVAILTLDRRDFRAIRPLTDAPSFQILPDDL